jgi:hypothetical protein
VLEQRSLLHGVADVRVALVHNLSLDEVLPGLVDVVEDVESLRLRIPRDVFAASQAVVEQDKELGALLGLGFQLFDGCYSGRHRYHAPCPGKARSERLYSKDSGRI